VGWTPSRSWKANTIYPAFDILREPTPSKIFENLNSDKNLLLSILKIKKKKKQPRKKDQNQTGLGLRNEAAS
jgi:hypothetical protein